jgi:hypothetical protein
MIERVAGVLVLTFMVCVVLFTGAVFWRLCAPVQEMPTPATHHLPSQCAHLYNVNRHEEWAECIGVGYVGD